MIVIYKYPNGDPNVGRKLFRLRECGKTWGNIMRLKEKQFNPKLRRRFFSVRAVRMWNFLPQSVVSARSIDNLKKKLDVHLSEHNIQ